MLLEVRICESYIRQVVRGCRIRNMRIIITAVLALSVFCEAKNSFSEEEQQKLVQLHNNKRSIVSPTAADMRQLEFSSDLAASAEAWADGCVWGHGTGDVTQRTYKTFGQNLFVSFPAFNISQSVDAWDDEKKHYTYSTATCTAVCGHYTQVVWAKSSKIGCGVKKCASMQNLSFKDAYYVVCHYHVAGNLAVNGKVLQPYEAGSSCSACPPEANVCNNQLCSAGRAANSTGITVLSSTTTVKGLLSEGSRKATLAVFVMACSLAVHF